MAAVVDANLLVALVTRDPRRPHISARFDAWDQAGESLHAPALMPYEVANALAGLVGAGLVKDAELDDAWTAVVDLLSRCTR